jgi:hypothetical protein
MSSLPVNFHADEAYMLGMLYGKGDILINDSGTECELIFKIKYRRPSVDALRTDNINVPLVSVNNIPIEVAVFQEFQDLRRSFQNFLGTTVDLRLINSGGRKKDNWEMKQVILNTGRFRTNSGIIRRLFDCDRITAETIQHIPNYFFDDNISTNLVLTFIQGFSDACGLPPSEVTAAFGGRGIQRIQLEPNWRRWYVPIEICSLFQTKLEIPVNMINWGHPLIRGINSYRGQNHQIRIRLDSINTNLFRLSFKSEAFEGLLDRTGRCTANQGIYNFCPSQVSQSSFYIHRCGNHNENDSDLPVEVRGIHLDDQNKNVQICKLLGCTSCNNFDIVEVT